MPWPRGSVRSASLPLAADTGHRCRRFRASPARCTALTELRRLGRTLTQRASDILAYFDRARASNGPTEASTAGSSTSADPPSASATSSATSPDPYSKPAASDLSYTLECDEPVMRLEFLASAACY
jgi:hypothetical protein